MEKGRNGYAEELRVEREMKDRFMGRHPESPFVAEGVPGFDGLRYFPVDERFCVEARLERRPVPEEAYLRTNRDGQSTVRYLGDLTFSLEGRRLRLRLYHAGEGVGTSVFVPFRDATSGSESYGPGRYITLELTEDDHYQLDFNRAFNPYCAYTDAYECGFPPAENDLPIEVRAGEMVWSTTRNPRTPQGAVRALAESKLPPRAASPPASPKPSKAAGRRRSSSAARPTRGRSRPRSR